MAHKYVSDTFGENWKDEYIVWDCAWGTGNLTRDYKFKELYCSTLEQSDIDTANQMNYNPEATKFQFDFLNGRDSDLPQSLQDAINNGKKILFLINPPYGTANNMGTIDGDHKSGIAKTQINKKMLSDGFGKASQNLYAQFLFKIYKFQQINKNINIGLFSPPLFLSGNSYKEFRSRFLNLFRYKCGFLFEASHFSSVSKGWGILFTVFDNLRNHVPDFIVDIIDIDKTSDYNLKSIGTKTIYNMDTLIGTNEWVRKEIKKIKTYDAPQMKSAINIKNSGRGRSIPNHIGYFANNGNSLYDTFVFLLSECSSRSHGLSILPQNFYKIVTLFTTRKVMLPISSWLNGIDEYIAPNEKHDKWNGFYWDSIIYSLFNNSSQQSSLRNITYQQRKWDIKNEFFWLSKEEMLELGNTNDYDELYKDAKNGEDRYVYNLLFGTERIYDKLSNDAKQVLDMGTSLLKKSIKERKMLSEFHPEYHLNSFDCGYAQLKLVWKEYYKEEFTEFRNLYKSFESRLRPLVYELGFLRK